MNFLWNTLMNVLQECVTIWKVPSLILVIEWQPRWTNVFKYEIHRWLVHRHTCVSNSCHDGCGRTAQNSTLLEALVLHQTVSTPKAGYIGRFRQAHPKRELEQSTFYIQNSIMSTSLQYLVHFIQEFLKIIYYNTRVQSMIIKQRNENKHLVKTIQRSVYAHQKNPPHKYYSSSCTCNRGK